MVRFLCTLLLLLSCASTAVAGSIPLRASVAPGIAGATQHVPPDTAFKPFDPTRLLPTQRPNGLWLRLRPLSGEWPAHQLLILSALAYQGTATLEIAGEPSVTTAPHSMDKTMLHGHGRVAFVLPRNLPAGAVLQLHFAEANMPTKAITVAVQPLAEFVSSDARWLVWVTACLTIIALMSLLALFFAVVLRDATYVYYAVYMLSFLALQALQSGYAFHPLELGIFASANVSWTLISLALSVAFSTLFLTRFTDMPRMAPRLRVAILTCGWFACATLLLAAAPNPTLHAAVRAIMLKVVAVQAILILLVAVIMLVRKSRYASVFLIGWIPLLIVGLVTCLQPYALLGSWNWISNAAIAAGAFDAVVLSLGLADRLRLVRRERDAARADADTDPLTGAINRRLWTRRAEALIGQAHAGGHPLSILFIDIDHFKELNDRHGHHVGDQALGTLVEFLRQQLRDNDLIGRYGGDEFVVALPGCDAAKAKSMGERLRRNVEHARQFAAIDGTPLTISVGCAELRANEGATSLLERADKAMYGAKHSGRNRVVHAASIVSVLHSQA